MFAEMNPPSVLVRRRSDSIATEIDGEVVVMSIATGRTFGLDRRASRIWTLLEQPRTIDGIVEGLLKYYETSVEKCRADVIEFVGELVTNQLATTEQAAL